MSEPPWTVLRILQWTAGFFEARGALSARLDAELLLAKVLNIARIQLYVQYDRPLTDEERDTFRALVARRGQGEPVQYLLGEQEFWSIPFKVEPGVLIPRPDTEVLVEEAVAHAKAMSDVAALRVADVGTGSGAIAVALASELDGAHVYAGDIAETPLRLAPDNAAAAGVGDRVTVVRGAGLGPLWKAADREPFHIIASNPPYIRAGEHPGLMREVRDHEPAEALVAGADGLDVIRPLVRGAAHPGVLAEGGVLLIEIGDAPQAEDVVALCHAAGLTATRIRADYAGDARVVVARRPNG